MDFPLHWDSFCKSSLVRRSNSIISIYNGAIWFFSHFLYDRYSILNLISFGGNIFFFTGIKSLQKHFVFYTKWTFWFSYHFILTSKSKAYISLQENVKGNSNFWFDTPEPLFVSIAVPEPKSYYGYSFCHSVFRKTKLEN